MAQDLGFKYYKRTQNGEPLYEKLPGIGVNNPGYQELDRDTFVNELGGRISSLAEKQQRLRNANKNWDGNSSMSLIDPDASSAGHEARYTGSLPTNSYISQLQSLMDDARNNPGAQSGYEMNANGAPALSKNLREQEANEAAEKAGTMRKVPLPNGGFGYLPTGSAADQLQSGLANGSVSATDPLAQYNASLKGNNVNAEGMNNIAPLQPNLPAQNQALNQVLTEGQMHPDGSGPVKFDSLTGKPLTPGQTTNSVPNIGAQLGAVGGTSGGSSGSPTDINSYVNQLKALQGLSPEEEALQKQKINLEDSYRQGKQNVGEQPIAMSFISGQQKSLEDRYNNSQIPLEQKLALAQAKRQAALDGAKISLDQANKDREYNADREDKKKSDLQFVSGTANQSAGYFDKDTGVFTKLGGGSNSPSGSTNTSPGGIKYTPTQIQSLKQAGIDPANDSASSYFLNAPKEFQDFWQRELANSPSKQKYTAAELHTYYTNWYNNVKKSSNRGA
jgi:hypothetical protein